MSGEPIKPPSGLHDGEPPAQKASLPARLLGQASAKADQQAPEVDHYQLDTTGKHQQPQHINETLPDSTTSSAGAPLVAKGDEERPLDPGTKDLGWSETEQEIAQPLLSGLKNKELWLLERRFNKQTFRVKRVEEDQLLNGLDCNIAEDHEFSPDRLRSTLERFYTSVILNLAAFAKHMARLRSWHEAKRSAAFAILYAVAWFFDKTLLALILVAILLIASPRSRLILFPPAPLATISATSGKPKIPEAQHLGSTSSLTGAAETYHGQAAEREAANFVSSLSSLAVSTAVGSDSNPVESDDEGDQDGAGEDETTAVGREGDASESKQKDSSALSEDALPDPSRVASSSITTPANTDPSVPADGDHTAAPVDNAVWSKAAPVLRVLEDICDTFERFGNALSPMPPFHQHVPRTRLAAVLAPLALLASLLDPNLVYRSTTFLVGFLFFGQPLMDRLKPEPLIAWLDAHVPHWKKMLQLKNTLLRGVPTNAQLTVALLRIGEANKSPLPPPPLPIAAEKEGKAGPEPVVPEGEEIADHPDIPPEYREELRRQAQEKQAQDKATGEDDSSSSKEKEKKKPSKIVSILKVTAKSLTASALGVNRAEATVLGTEASRARLGVVKKALAERALGDGPAAFKARYKGKKGLVIISTSSTTPCVSFEPRQPAVTRAAMSAVDQMRSKGEEAKGSGKNKTSVGSDGASGAEQTTKQALEKTVETTRRAPLFSIQIEDIVDLSKRGGLGWKAKLLVSWAMDSDIADGLEVITKTGEKFLITAMPRRDEVFNRLIALSPNTTWELA
ncbi:hypothetical protein OC861_005276 [Tilletia horrida]|nr:hypothetical protein OC861_005276 [Tilletia horrida]